MTKSNIKINLTLDKKKSGIWQYASYLAPVRDTFCLSLNEGATEETSFDGITLKREDKNPTGSLKDRGMAFLISKALEEGKRNLVISSSGNAAISAAEYCNLAKINLAVFVSSKINKRKLEKINEKGAEIFQSLRPVSEAIKFARKKNFFNLRPSRNEFGSEGYQTIAFELAQKEGVIDDFFLPVSSGTALLGIAKGFRKLGFVPRFHICQPASFCPLSGIYDKDSVLEKENLVDALVAKFTPLKGQIINLIKECGGSGWVVENKQIVSAEEVLSAKKIDTSFEGALALACIIKARQKGVALGKTVCLLTGTKR